jgi:hypothetical protein
LIKLHNEQLHNFYPSSNTIRVTNKDEKGGGAGNKNTYTILKEEPDGERPLYKPGHRTEYNIKTGLRTKMGGLGMN